MMNSLVGRVLLPRVVGDPGLLVVAVVCLVGGVDGVLDEVVVRLVGIICFVVPVVI